MSDLTHPLIQNGWFKEVSDESFPGQALELKVKKILHSAKSEFQDVSLACFSSLVIVLTFYRS